MTSAMLRLDARPDGPIDDCDEVGTVLALTATFDTLASLAPERIPASVGDQSPSRVETFASGVARSFTPGCSCLESHDDQEVPK